MDRFELFSPETGLFDRSRTEKSKSAQNLSSEALGSAQPSPMFRLGRQEEHERIREEVIDLKITERLSVAQVVRAVDAYRRLHHV